MRRLLIPVIALAVSLTATCQPAYAQQSPWSISAYYSFRMKDSAVVASNRIDRIEDFLRIKGLNLDLNAFAGAGARGSVLAGFTGTVDIEIGKGWFLSPGLGIDGDFSDVSKIQFDRIGLGVTLGLSRRF